MTRNYVSFSTEDSRIELAGGVILTRNTRTYGYENEAQSSYQYNDVIFDAEVGGGFNQLAALVVALKNIPQDGAFDLYAEELEEFLKEWASETAEELEVPFTFTDSLGNYNTYTPASMWEASGGCEWEESAQYGSDYGWNI